MCIDSKSGSFRLYVRPSEFRQRTLGGELFLKRSYGALILAGGLGRRMGGQNKALLRLENRTFLARLEDSLQSFDEKLISVQDASWIENTSFLPVRDQVSGRGPLEGLRCALNVCRSDALIVVPCDVPLFSADLARALISAGENFDAAVCRDRTGRLHPLCGMYSKSCLPVIEAMAVQGDFRIMNILDRVDSTILSLESAGICDALLTNINDPQSLEALNLN